MKYNPINPQHYPSDVVFRLNFHPKTWVYEYIFPHFFQRTWRSRLRHSNRSNHIEFQNKRSFLPPSIISWALRITFWLWMNVKSAQVKLIYIVPINSVLSLWYRDNSHISFHVFEITRSSVQMFSSECLRVSGQLIINKQWKLKSRQFKVHLVAALELSVTLQSAPADRVCLIAMKL